MEVWVEEGVDGGGAFQGVEWVDGGAPFGMGSNEFGDLLFVVFYLFAVS